MPPRWILYQESNLEEEKLKYYENLLKNFIKKKLVCTNPDLTVHRGGVEEYCAGKIAEIFESLGGEVIYFGKPHKEVYDSFQNKFNLDNNSTAMFEDHHIN